MRRYKRVLAAFLICGLLTESLPVNGGNALKGTMAAADEIETEELLWEDPEIVTGDEEGIDCAADGDLQAQSYEETARQTVEDISGEWEEADTETTGLPVDLISSSETPGYEEGLSLPNIELQDGLTAGTDSGLRSIQEDTEMLTEECGTAVKNTVTEAEEAETQAAETEPAEVETEQLNEDSAVWNNENNDTNEKETERIKEQETQEIESEYASEYVSEYESEYEVQNALSDSRMAMAAITDNGSEPHLWSFDYYYVNEDDLHDVTKTADFNLKTQMDFHTSQTLPAGTVVITVPQKLLNERSGSDRESVLPDDISLPAADTEGIDSALSDYETAAAVIAGADRKRIQDTGGLHFNYFVNRYGELVFFNYDEIFAGTNCVWQILYKRLYQMDIPDGTEWELEACARVKPEETALPQKQTASVKGRTDSAVTLRAVTKTAAQDKTLQYTPGLYTQSQVSAYISTYASDQWREIIEDSERFSQYRYAVWEVSVRGEGNQPWDLFVEDMPSYLGNGETGQGEVVGFMDHSRDGGYSLFQKADSPLFDGHSWLVRSRNARENLEVSFYVVTAFPNTVTDGDLLQNEVKITLQPTDLQDPVQTKTACAEWSYRTFHWNYNGEIIGIHKANRYTGTHEQNYYGWLKKYELFRQKGMDAGNLPFETYGRCFGYAYTHEIGEEGTASYGKYLPGSYYRITCVDDAVYAFCGDRQVLLTDADYYFDEVEFIRSDRGFDIWEAKTSAAEHPEGLDQTMTVYGMFEGSSNWEPVGTAEFNEGDTARFAFSDEQLARHPYRVKAEYNACSYSTGCTIRVSVCLKKDSPVLTQLLYNGSERNSASVLQIENLSGIAGQTYGVRGMADGTWFQDTSVNGDNGHGGTNYSEPGLIDFTRNLYGTILMRDCALKLFTDLHGHAAAAKTASITNDAAHRRVLVQYDLTQYDGYDVYAEDLIPYLKEMGIESPGLHNVVWYDLLPTGMYFDASGPITAGRISALKADRRSWDTNQVTVSVNPAEDVIANWRGTGRTMVILHIQYDGVDPARYTEDLWAQGWGVSFRAYYNWDSLTAGDNPNNANLAAFMPGGEAASRVVLPGAEGEVFADNGTVPETGGYEGYFDSGDLNDDGVQDIRNVLYARTWVSEDIAVGAKDSIEKKVRSDADISAPFDTTAYTLPESTYTYAITVSTASGMRDLVVFDRLENALQDRADIPYESFPMESDSWYGTFAGIDVSEAQLLGIQPVIYYHADRDAPLFAPSSVHSPGDVDTLLSSGGWMSEEEWFSAGKLISQVRAVAVDLRTGESGPFELKKGSAVTLRIQMRAPAQTGAEWAYNNPGFFSTRLSDTASPETAFVTAV